MLIRVHLYPLELDAERNLRGRNDTPYIRKIPLNAVHSHDLADEALLVGLGVEVCAVDEKDLAQEQQEVRSSKSTRARASSWGCTPDGRWKLRRAW